jgi:hypothetical protein
MSTVYFIPLFILTGLYSLYMGSITKVDYLIQTVLSIFVAIIATVVVTGILNFLGF